MAAVVAFLVTTKCERRVATFIGLVALGRGMCAIGAVGMRQQPARKRQPVKCRMRKLTQPELPEDRRPRNQNDSGHDRGDAA